MGKCQRLFHLAAWHRPGDRGRAAGIALCRGRKAGEWLGRAIADRDAGIQDAFGTGGSDETYRGFVRLDSGEMPTGARPLGEYDRYYSGVRLSGREGVQGVLLLREAFAHVNRGAMAPVEGMANVYRGDANAMPLVADGGCSVVTLYFDLASQEFVELHREGLSVERARAVCNGVA